MSDDATSEQIEAKLKARLGFRVTNLRVVIQDETIVLHGRASTYHAKQLAQHLAVQASGLPVAANHIEVA